MNPIDKILLMRAKVKFAQNLKMAEQFKHNPELAEKFLSQAIDAEIEINSIEGAMA